MTSANKFLFNKGREKGITLRYNIKSNTLKTLGFIIGLVIGR